MMRQDLAVGAKELTGLKQKLYGFLVFGQLDLSEKALANDAKWAKRLGTLGVPLALLVHGYTGFILANIQARALWHTGLMPLIFLMSAMVSGTGLLMLVLMFTQRFLSPEKALTPDRKALIYDIAQLMLWFIVVDATLMVIDFIVLYYTNAAGHAAAELFLFGSHRPMFLGVEVGLGLLVPFILMLLPRTKRSLGWISLASVLTLIGVIAMRINFVIGGQQLPLSTDTLNPYVVDPNHLLMIGIFAIAEMTILYLAFRLLPIYGLPRIGSDSAPYQGEVVVKGTPS